MPSSLPPPPSCINVLSRNCKVPRRGRAQASAFSKLAVFSLKLLALPAPSHTHTHTHTHKRTQAHTHTYTLWHTHVHLCVCCWPEFMTGPPELYIHYVAPREKKARSARSIFSDLFNGQTISSSRNSAACTPAMHLACAICPGVGVCVPISLSADLHMCTKCVG